MSEFEKEVLEILKKIDKKLDRILGAEPTTVPAEVMPKPEVAASSAKSSEVVTKQEEPEPAEEIPAAEGRRVCPKCGATEFNQIEDKSKILHSMGGMKIYAKNHQCKKCGMIL